jgi:hypothetical protein
MPLLVVASTVCTVCAFALGRLCPDLDAGWFFRLNLDFILDSDILTRVV